MGSDTDISQVTDKSIGKYLKNVINKSIKLQVILTTDYMNADL